jgi:hypothetical protein
MSWTTERARVASLSRSRTPDDPELIEARHNLAYERLCVSIQRALSAWTPTRGQRARLAALIADDSAGGAA